MQEVVQRLITEGYNVTKVNFPQIDIINKKIGEILSSLRIPILFNRYLKGEKEVDFLRFENVSLSLMNKGFKNLLIKYRKLRGE